MGRLRMNKGVLSQKQGRGYRRMIVRYAPVRFVKMCACFIPRPHYKRKRQHGKFRLGKSSFHTSGHKKPGILDFKTPGFCPKRFYILSFVAVNASKQDAILYCVLFAWDSVLPVYHKIIDFTGFPLVVLWWGCKSTAFFKLAYISLLPNAYIADNAKLRHPWLARRVYRQFRGRRAWERCSAFRS